MIFWMKKNKLYPKMMKFGSKLKNRYGEGKYFYSLIIKKIIVIMIFWRKKKKLYPKMMKFGSKQKRDMERESTVNSLQLKKEYSEHLKI